MYPTRLRRQTTSNPGNMNKWINNPGGKNNNVVSKYDRDEYGHGAD